MLSPIVRNVATGLAVVLALSAGAHAQQPTPAQFQRATERLEAWRKGRTHVYMDDFGELKRYRAANAKLGAPAPTEKRVVFFGDSITDMWPLAAAFPGKPYVNRGISGQTTSQMLVRFRNDVIALAPAVVVILAGTNDIAGNTGPMSLEDIEANFTDMVELARAHGVRVVLSSVIPVHNYAAATGSVYLDYAAAMSDDKKMLRRDLADDGLHPNKAGYAIMGPLAEQAIAKALGGV